MGFFIYVFLVSIPALIFSILAWRLRTNLFFWLGLGFTALMIVLYLYEIRFLLSLLANIDEMIWGIFFLALLGLPVFFLINSKLVKENRGDSDVTDDYLNSIINGDDDVDME